MHGCRLSLRSFVYTCTFFATGIAACLLGGTIPALGIANQSPAYMPLTGSMRAKALSLLATAVIGTAAFGLAAHKTQRKAVSTAYDGFAGLAFGLALCLSGMTRPTLVCGQHAAKRLFHMIICAVLSASLLLPASPIDTLLHVQLPSCCAAAAGAQLFVLFALCA